MFWTRDCCFENLDIFITGANTVPARDGWWVALQKVQNMEWCLVIFVPIEYHRIDVELQIVIDIQTTPEFFTHLELCLLLKFVSLPKNKFIKNPEPLIIKSDALPDGP